MRVVREEVAQVQRQDALAVVRQRGEAQAVGSDQHRHHLVQVLRLFWICRIITWPQSGCQYHIFRYFISNQARNMPMVSLKSNIHTNRCRNRLANQISIRHHNTGERSNRTQTDYVIPLVNCPVTMNPHSALDGAVYRALIPSIESRSSPAYA